VKIFFNFSLNEYSNSYVLAPHKDSDAVLIDPGQITLELIEKIERHRLNIKYILLTHYHHTHSQGVGTLLKIYKPVIYAKNPALYEYPVVGIEDNQLLELGETVVECFHIPGHSMDSIVYKIENFIFSGDVLLAGSIGSTKEVINKALLLRGIKERLLTLDERFLIFPGHGAISALKIEKLFNRDLIEATKEDDLQSLSHPSIV